MALLPQGIRFQQASQLLAPSASTGMQGASPQSLVLDHVLAGSGLNQKIFLIPAICFHHSFHTFTPRTENKFSSGRAEAQSICSADSGRLQTGVDDHEGIWSLQFNKPSHFTVSSEGRTKWSLYDQDYTRLLYSCLCWGSHLFKTATSNISKVQWPHLASWSQPVENSFTSLLTVLQTQAMLGWRKGTLILLPSFLHLILLPIISYRYLFNLSHSSSARIFVLMHKA